MKNPISRMSRSAKLLENRFFFEQNQILKEQLAELKKKEENIKALSNVSGIKNEAVLKELVDLDIRPEILAALCLIPIIEVAWADGSIHEKERDAVLEGARKSGYSYDEDMLREWLKTKPDPKLMDAWKIYMQGLCEILDQDAITVLRDEIVGHTQAVAEASGGFLGLTNPISQKERDMLDEISGFFSKPGECGI